MRIALLLSLCLAVFAAETVIQPVSTPPVAAPAQERVEIGNSIARVEFETRRGAITRFTLIGTKPVSLPAHLAKRVDLPPLGDLAILRDFFPDSMKDAADDGAHGWLGAEGVPGHLDDVAVPWSIVDRTPTSVTFERELAGEARFRIVHTMDASRPSVQTTLSILNEGGAEITVSPNLRPFSGLHQDYGPNEVAYLSVFSHSGGSTGSLTTHSFPTPEKDLELRSATERLDFVGLKARFFAVWWTPTEIATADPAEAKPVRDSAKTSAVVAAAKGGDWTAVVKGYTSRADEHQARLWVTYPGEILKPGEKWQRSWTISVSGMTKADLTRLNDSERSIEFTDWMYKFFKILAKGLTWVLDLLAMVVRNYGVAVILLTVLIKAVLHKTTVKQQASMLKMQKLAPELKYLQEQYKNNKQVLGQKMMELYKKHGANPLSGCLPILIQLPLFIALFQAFSHCADLRGSSFLWIHDLTLPDQVWGTQISWLGGWLFSINPLPIIYICVAIWTGMVQKPPTNGDPQQEMMFKMMRWMPAFFGLIFYNMPSGLVLYFTVQSVISTLETMYVRRKLGMN